MAETALRETRATGIAIALQEGTEFVCRATAGTTVPSLEVRIDRQSGITGACIRSGQSEICQNASTDDRVNAAACEALQIASVIAVPIIRNDLVVGVLEALSKRPFAFGSVERIFLEELASKIHFPPAVNNVPGSVSKATLPINSSASQGLSPLFASNLKDVASLAPRPREDEVVASSELASFRTRGTGVKTLLIPLLVFAVVSVIIATGVMRMRSAGRQGALPSVSPLRVSSASAPSLKADFANTADGEAANAAALDAAARAGNPSAQLRFATVLAQGSNGLTKDPIAAYAWYVVANLAGQNDSTGQLPSLARTLTSRQIAEARFRVASMYWEGIGVKRDRTAAYSWLVLAEASGFQDAARYETQLAALMSPSEVQEARRHAATWLQQHQEETIHADGSH